jgi:hypothetical protein
MDNDNKARAFFVVLPGEVKKFSSHNRQPTKRVRVEFEIVLFNFLLEPKIQEKKRY